MKTDIEIACVASELEAGLLKTELSGMCTVTVREKSKYTYLRTDQSEALGKPVGQSLFDFLELLLPKKNIFLLMECKVRIGVFFDVGEIAFLVVEFSKRELARLAEFNFALEISNYPCSTGE